MITLVHIETVAVSTCTPYQGVSSEVVSEGLDVVRGMGPGESSVLLDACIEHVIKIEGVQRDYLSGKLQVQVPKLSQGYPLLGPSADDMLNKTC